LTQSGVWGSILAIRHTHALLPHSRCASTLKTITLNTIAPAPGSRKKFRRVGRGEGSSKGKTAGRGMKGTWGRRSMRKLGFEGGQAPIKKIIPKRGFTNVHAKPLQALNLDRVLRWVIAGRLDSSKPITLKALYDSKIVKFEYGIKLLGLGASLVNVPLHFEVSHCSATAREAVEKSGGSVKLVYFNRVTLRNHLKPHLRAQLELGATTVAADTTHTATATATTKRNATPPPKLRARYAPYDHAIPPLLFKSRIDGAITAGFGRPKATPLNLDFLPPPTSRERKAKKAARRDTINKLAHQHVIQQLTAQGVPVAALGGAAGATTATTANTSAAPASTDKRKKKSTMS
jgi:large subunit ribosomal protein L15